MKCYIKNKKYVVNCIKLINLNKKMLFLCNILCILNYSKKIM
jgi:hypothetical protein